MCRHLAYLGPAVALARLLFEPSYSLVRQAWQPRDMRGGGTINADGFGIGWYASGRPTPLRYRRGTPLWSDEALPSMAQTTASGAILAAVRSATVGMPVGEHASAPFTDGPWLFSHNGLIAGWPDSMEPLAARLPVRELLTLDAPTDAALLWALVRHQLRSGVSAPAAMASVVTAVAGVAPGSRLNLLLTDGMTAVATAVGHSLSVREGDGSVLISSEPLDDEPGWRPVPDASLVTATVDALSVEPLVRLGG